MMKINLKKFKGVNIEYCCTECNLWDNFFEDFKNGASKIKPETKCKHYDFKFIYNLSIENFKFVVSFNCKKCPKSEIINLYNPNLSESFISYKCKNCNNNGEINVRMMLSEEAIKDDENIINPKKNEKNNIQNINNNINRQMINNNNNININNNNNFNINNFGNFNNNLNRNNNNFNINNNFNYNPQMNNINVMGGNMNQINNMNFNNNMMMNNMFFPMMNGNMNINMNMNPNMNNNMMFNNFNNMNNQNNMNIMMGNMNINNNNGNNNNNSINLQFKDTKGGIFNLNVSSIDEVFGSVVMKLIKKYDDKINEDEINSFVCNATPIKNHLTLKENNINNGDIIMIMCK